MRAGAGAEDRQAWLIRGGIRDLAGAACMERRTGRRMVGELCVGVWLRLGAGRCARSAECVRDVRGRRAVLLAVRISSSS